MELTIAQAVTIRRMVDQIEDLVTDLHIPLAQCQPIFERLDTIDEIVGKE